MYVCVHVCLCVLVTGTPRGHARDSGGSVLAVTGQSPTTRRDARQDGARPPPPRRGAQQRGRPGLPGLGKTVWGRLRQGTMVALLDHEAGTEDALGSHLFFPCPSVLL